MEKSDKMGLKLKFWKNEEEKPKEDKKVVLDQKSLEIGSAIGELNQKFDKITTAVGQCFIALDQKIDTYKDNIVVIQDGISKQIEQHEAFKSQLESYEEKILRLLRNIRFEIETEIHATKDEETKKRLGHTLEKIDTSLILSLIKEKGPIETKALEEEILKKGVCSRATLFRKLGSLREKGLVIKEEREGTSFYSILSEDEIKEESNENLEETKTWN
jgi:predicted transcriptional regulator